MSDADTLPPPPGYERGLVAGKYRLTRQIGSGGMGTVWEGVHETLGTKVAIKVIESEHVESPESLRRFENEAHAAARLQSKHVVEVYDHGVMADGRAFIVMQYLKGEPLERRLERLGRLSPRETARIILQVCRALSKAHASGIVHRDLKPENIFLVWDDEDGADIVKVVDFGIAKFTAPTSEAAGTHTGSLLGTPFYMSPEQARGLRTVDHRSDLWSVGVITFRCMVGSLPFEGESVGDVLVKLCTGPIPTPSEIVPDLPPGFDAWMARVLSREPSARFSSAAELAESLAAICGVPVRPAYSTGDIPLSSSGDGPIITPSYADDALPSDPTLASHLVGGVRTGPEVSIGGGLTNTPTHAARRSKAPMFAVLGVGLIVVAVSAAALVLSRSGKEPSSATGAPVPSPPLPPTDTAASAVPAPPIPAASADLAAAATRPSAVPDAATTAIESAPKQADRRAPAPPPKTASPSTAGRAPGKVTKKAPAPAPSRSPAPPLDIRLER